MDHKMGIMTVSAVQWDLIRQGIIEATIAELKIPVSDRSCILSQKETAESTARRGTQRPQSIAVNS